MPVITKITEQKRRPNRRSVYLDGAFAFGCNVNVVARFRLREGLKLSDEQVLEIERGEVRQDCFDAAMRFLEQRLHSTAELRRKLGRHEYGDKTIDGVVADLTRMNYLDDARFAQSKAQSAIGRKHHGRRRAKAELMKSGVKSDIADRALDVVYDKKSDSVDIAKQLAEKQSPRLKKLDPAVAKRRLVGMLQRRGFSYDEIKPVIEAVLGAEPEES